MKFFLRQKWFFYLGFLLLIPSLILNFFLYQKVQKSAALPEAVKVKTVLDGDTILLEGDVRIRLRNIDAPELAYCGGEEAKKTLERLVLGKEVVLREKISDQWGRPMALVYQGEILVNEEMLKSGWVRYHHDQNSLAWLLKKEAETAQKQEKGVFSPKCYQRENRENPACNIKGNIDKNSQARNYYYPGCAQYSFTIVEKDLGEDWFCNEEEAQAKGFSKAKTCP